MLHFLFVLLFFNNINPIASLPTSECPDYPPQFAPEWPSSEAQPQQQQPPSQPQQQQQQQPPSPPPAAQGEWWEQQQRPDDQRLPFARLPVDGARSPPPSAVEMTSPSRAEKRAPTSPADLPSSSWDGAADVPGTPKSMGSPGAPKGMGSPGAPGGVFRGDTHQYLYQHQIKFPNKEKKLHWQIWDGRVTGVAKPGWYIKGRMKPTDDDILVHRGLMTEGPAIARGTIKKRSNSVVIEYSQYRLPGTPDRVKLKHWGIWTREHTIDIAGRQLTWKATRNGHYTSQDLKLVDATREGELWAVIALEVDESKGRWGWFRISKDFYEDKALRRDPKVAMNAEEYESLMEQVIVSGMAMFFQELGNRRGTPGNVAGVVATMGAVGAASGGGGGGGGC
jgi:hypothetical protein